MMRICIYILGLLFMATGCCSKNDGYRITGEIENLPEGVKILLTPGATHRQEKPADATVAENGRFIFEGKVESPRLFYLSVEGYGGAESLLVGNDDIRIRGKFRAEEDGKMKRMDLESFQVTGSALQDSLLIKRRVRQELDELYTLNLKRYEATSRELGRLRSLKNPDSVRLFMETDAYKQMVNDEKHFFETVEKKYNELIERNTGSWWGPFLMMDLYSYFTADQKSMYDKLSKQAKESYYGQLVKAELFPETMEGKMAPSFTASDVNGKAYTLPELLAGKKYLLIDFWASWCGPCRKSIPQMKAVYEQYTKQGLGMVGISWDKDQAAWKKALAEEQMPWVNLLGTEEVFSQYDIRTIPSVFIVDAEGRIKGAKLHGDELVNKLQELFR